MTPPINGPRAGPRRGPRRYIPNTPARSSGVYMSLIVPPPFAIPTEPKNPASVRMTRKVSKFGLSAVGICRIVNIPKQIM